MLCKVYLFLAVVSVAEMKKIGCEDFELSEWDCETLLYKISEDNIRHTLYCLGYDKGTRPLSPNKTRLHVARTLDQLIEVDEDNGMIELEEDYSNIDSINPIWKIAKNLLIFTFNQF